MLAYLTCRVNLPTRVSPAATQQPPHCHRPLPCISLLGGPAQDEKVWDRRSQHHCQLRQAQIQFMSHRHDKMQGIYRPVILFGRSETAQTLIQGQHQNCPPREKTPLHQPTGTPAKPLGSFLKLGAPQNEKVRGSPPGSKQRPQIICYVASHNSPSMFPRHTYRAHN